jgi:hypothetical protein
VTRNFSYRGFGLSIDSEIELPGLPTLAKQEPADVVIRRGAVPRSFRPATLREEVAIHGAGASFLIRDGCEVIVDPRPDIDPFVLGALLQGRVMAFLFRERGWLPLHASGVVIGSKCILFLGNARAGKSTTAAAFHKCGHAVVTDDVAPVRVDSDGRCVLQSGWPHVRLREDAQTLFEGSDLTFAQQAGKRRYDLDSARPPNDLYPLQCAYVLEYGDEVSAGPLDPAGAIPLLSGCSFVRHRRMSRDALGAHLRDCCSVARALPVRRITRPSSLRRLAEMVHFVEEDLRLLS